MNAVEKRLVREFVQLAKEKGFEEVIECCRIPQEVSAEMRITDIKRRLKTNRVDLSRMSWDYCDPGTAETHYRGEVFEHEIPDNIFLVGDAITGKTVTRFMKKFVSHPFHQHGRSNIA